MSTSARHDGRGWSVDVGVRVFVGVRRYAAPNVVTWVGAWTDCGCECESAQRDTPTEGKKKK